jgi:hypothetical protein
VGEAARIVSSITSSLKTASRAFFGRSVSSLLIKQASVSLVGGLGESTKNSRMNNLLLSYAHLFHRLFGSGKPLGEVFLGVFGVVGWVGVA